MPSQVGGFLVVNMANNKSIDNLKKGKATQFKAGEEQAERARRAGKASGAARRRKRMLRDGVAAVLAEEAPDNVKAAFARNGFDVESVDDGLIASIIIGGLKGNVRMLELIADLLGEREKDVLRRELLDLDRERLEMEKARSEAEIRRISLTTRALDDDDDGDGDDGFIEALKGTAKDDWSDAE